MGLPGEYFLESSHILQTIQRSQSFCLINFVKMLTNNRVLIATIRDMGNLPCPRCLVPKTQISNLGTPRDTNTRTKKIRKDNLEYRCKIECAREIIYKQKYSVNSEAVENILKPESLVPTNVRTILQLNPRKFINCCISRMLSRQLFLNSGLISSGYFGSTSSMRSN